MIFETLDTFGHEQVVFCHNKDAGLKAIIAIHNTTLGTDYNDADRMSGIWQLRWLASENLSADLNLNYAKTRQRPRGLQCSPSSENFGSGWLATLQNGAIKPSHGGKSVEDLCLDSAATDKDTIIQDLGGGYDAENKGASVTLDWDLGDNMGLKSISAWPASPSSSSTWEEKTP